MCVVDVKGLMDLSYLAREGSDGIEANTKLQSLSKRDKKL